MSISELIEKLSNLREEYGDCDIECRNVAGEFDIADTVQVVNICKKKGFATWRVFIEG